MTTSPGSPSSRYRAPNRQQLLKSFHYGSLGRKHGQRVLLSRERLQSTLVGHSTGYTLKVPARVDVGHELCRLEVLSGFGVFTFRRSSLNHNNGTRCNPFVASLHMTRCMARRPRRLSVVMFSGNMTKLQLSFSHTSLNSAIWKTCRDRGLECISMIKKEGNLLTCET